MTNLLVEVFKLTIGLRVISRHESDVDVEVLTEGFPYPECKLGTPVGENVFQEAVDLEHSL